MSNLSLERGGEGENLLYKQKQGFLLLMLKLETLNLKP